MNTDDPFHKQALALKFRQASQDPVVQKAQADRARSRQQKADLLATNTLTDSQLNLPVLSAELPLASATLTPTEMAALTNTTRNTEFSQTFSRGKYWLTRADFATPNRVQVLPWKPDTAWLSHSHPLGYSGNPSSADRNALRALGQEFSRVVRPDGTSLSYGK